ncbi:MAG: M20/M25/M40 family metallo-hydrolase [Nocardioidaceae bacterium]
MARAAQVGSHVDLLRELVRVKSVNPPGDERGVANLLERQLSEAGMSTQILDSSTGRPSLVARLDGPRDRPALVLLSHSDVVPVEPDAWSRDPFAADISGGYLWGRGTLDMKGIAVMHAAAAAQVARSARAVTRELIVVVVPDEEDGGGEGARWLISHHPEKLGFEEGRPRPEVLGEGGYGVSGVIDRPVMPIVLGEKTAVTVEIVAEGDAGHGALPPRDQAAVNVAKIVRSVAGFGTPRVHPVMREQFAALAPAAGGSKAGALRALASRMGGATARAVAATMRRESSLGLLLSDSVTPTVLAAGYKANVVPGEARATFDCRLLPDTDVDRFVSAVNKRARRHGGRVAAVVDRGHGPVSDKGPLYGILERASADLDALPVASLTPTITDLRFFRARGATGYGWCPLVLTPELLATVHGHNERVNVVDFERAVQIMTDVVVDACT